MSTNGFATTDLCDTHEGRVRIAAPIFRQFGGRRRFCGPIETLHCFEDNSLVRTLLSEPGEGRVLVVDGAGSLRCALVGDQLGALAVKNDWSGIVVHGCVRDTSALAALDVGVLALAAHPKRSDKRGAGTRGAPAAFAGIAFLPGEWLYADEDGLLVASDALA